MKSLSGKFFMVKVSVEREKEDGLMKRQSESYVVKAISFTDCEAKITEEVGSYDNVKNSFDVKSEAIAPFKEVFLFDEGEIYYKVKIKETWCDEVTAKENTTTYNYLVNAGSLDEARKNIVEALGSTLKDYVIAAVVETKVLDLFE